MATNWQITPDGKEWPITISKPGSIDAPAWVWGDADLATKIVELMNAMDYEYRADPEQDSGASRRRE